MSWRERLRKSAQAIGIPAVLAVERLQTGVSFNPLSRSFQVDPYPAYRRLREKDPCHLSRLADSWMLSRYEDVSAILRDPRFLVDDRKLPRYAKRRERLVRAGAIDKHDVDTPSMLTLDPPDHTRIRSLVGKVFAPRAVEALRPRVEEIVRDQLDAVAATGEMDVMRDLANPLPVTVIAEMMGVPAEDRDQFKRWSSEAILLLGVGTPEHVRRSRTAVHELEAYFGGIAEERRRDPREDIVSILVTAEEDGDKLSMDEVFSTCTLILIAGHETTTNLIGNGLLALLRHPDQLEALRRDPVLIDGAVEELLRFDGPIQFTARFALEETPMGGRTIKAGQQVALLLGAANRDPARFSEPDKLDITRENNEHLSFSQGIHFCLGAALARLEAQVALPAILERFPNMRLATDELEWNDNLVLRGLKSLPVTF